ncbi:hypothetical protein V6N13_048213 [Hibiscus sabdariffa]
MLSKGSSDDEESQSDKEEAISVRLNTQGCVSNGEGVKLWWRVKLLEVVTSMRYFFLNSVSPVEQVVSVVVRKKRDG